MPDYIVKASKKNYFEIKVRADSHEEAADNALSGESPSWEFESVKEGTVPGEYLVTASQKEYREIHITAQSKQEASNSALNGELSEWEFESVEELELPKKLFADF